MKVSLQQLHSPTTKTEVMKLEQNDDDESNSDDINSTTTCETKTTIMNIKSLPSSILESVEKVELPSFVSKSTANQNNKLFDSLSTSSDNDFVNLQITNLESTLLSSKQETASNFSIPTVNKWLEDYERGALKTQKSLRKLSKILEDYDSLEKEEENEIRNKENLIANWIDDQIQQVETLSTTLSTVISSAHRESKSVISSHSSFASDENSSVHSAEPCNSIPCKIINNNYSNSSTSDDEEEEEDNKKIILPAKTDSTISNILFFFSRLSSYKSISQIFSSIDVFISGWLNSFKRLLRIIEDFMHSVQNYIDKRLSNSISSAFTTSISSFLQSSSNHASNSAATNSSRYNNTDTHDTFIPRSQFWPEPSFELFNQSDFPVLFHPNSKSFR